MYPSAILNLLRRCTVNSAIVPFRSIFLDSPLNLNVTSVLFAEPLKKKKRLDPAIIRAREERKRRKIEKSIRRLEKHAQQPKPIAELELPLNLRDDLISGKIKLPEPTEQQMEEKQLLLKQYSQYRMKIFKKNVKLLDSLMKTKEDELEKLRNESEDLYQQAIQIDPTLLPYSAKGPTNSPSIDNFDAPDGEYIDITKKYYGE